MDKNYTEVTIAGKTYTLGGYEDAEYLQQIAAYINPCISALHQMPGVLRQSADDQNMMLRRNLADDCFKARKKAASLEAKAEMMEKEIYNLKHELITNQLRNENK